MKSFFFFLICFIGFCLNASEKPNVLFISIDDLNDFPSFLGHYPDAKTPNMDRLAKKGISFSNAHCQYPLCGPSRASVMSGFHPSTLNFATHMSDMQVKNKTEELGSKVMNDYFSSHGYKTMAKGKIFHKHVPEGTVDVSGGRGGFSEGTGKLQRNWHQKGTSTDWAMAPEQDSELPDFGTAEWAVEQLNQDHEKPFMMMVGFLRPHVPWYVPKKWFDLYDRDQITLPPFKENDLNDVPDIAKKLNILSPYPRTTWTIEEDEFRDIVHAYLACISFVDDQLGKVLQALEKSTYHDNTIIVLWSDHGYHIGEKNTFQKQTLWQRSSHVPLLFAGKGIKGNQRCERVVSLLDLYPTLVDLCGLPANSKNEGKSLAKLIKNPQLPWNHPAITAWQGNNYAIQTEKYRYIIYEDGSEELYDHEKDLNEWNNLASHPGMSEIKKELMAALPKTKYKTTKKYGKK